MGNAYGGDEITPWLDNSVIILSDVVVSLFMVELEVLEASTDYSVAVATGYVYTRYGR